MSEPVQEPDAVEAEEAPIVREDEIMEDDVTHRHAGEVENPLDHIGDPVEYDLSAYDEQ